MLIAQPSSITVVCLEKLILFLCRVITSTKCLNPQSHFRIAERISPAFSCSLIGLERFRFFVGLDEEFTRFRYTEEGLCVGVEDLVAVIIGEAIGVEMALEGSSESPEEDENTS